MLRWPAFLVLMVLLQLCETRLAPARFAPDLGVGLIVFLGLFVRPSALPALLAIVALVRAPLCGAAPSSMFLLLGCGVVLLLPLRRWFFQGSLPYLAILSVSVTLLLLLAHHLHLPDRSETLLTERPVGLSLLAAALLGPFLVLLLRAAPPTAWFVGEDAA